jgi:hypothetical protein
MYSCECCCDSHLSIKKGLICSNVNHPHYICDSGNKDCFSSMVITQTNEKDSFIRNGNYIICAYCTSIDARIVTPFDLSNVAKHANTIALAAFRRAVLESVKSVPVCMICLDGPKVIALLLCGHKAYCAACFVDPILSQGNCPYCRTPITGTVPLFD